jgi:hypothetical protein
VTCCCPRPEATSQTGACWRRFNAPLRGAALLLAVTAPASALAHDTWLLPAQYRVRPGVPVMLELTSAMRFPEPETPVKPERLAATGLRLRGSTRPLQPGQSAAKVLRLSAATAGAGIATVWVESRPRDIDLQPQEVEEYLAEAGASDVRELWTKNGRGPWRETYVKLAKSFVRVGEPSDDRSWTEPAGLALEIVPEADPTSLTPAQPLRLRVLEDGGPAAGLAVAAVAAGEATPIVRTTDSGGRVTLPLSRPGQWLIKAIRIRPGVTPGTWRSRFTTVTVSVGDR